jgi:hypothetical protein
LEPCRARELLDVDVHQLAALRALIRAWSRAYRDDGLIVIGVHTPEFAFEHETDRVGRATAERAIGYSIAVDTSAPQIDCVAPAGGRAVAGSNPVSPAKSTC